MKKHQWVGAVATLAAVTVLLLAGTAVASRVQGGTVNDEQHAEVMRAPMAPADFWSSPWVALLAGAWVDLSHNLGGNPDQLVVDMWSMDTAPGGIGINHYAYGGLEIDGSTYGAYWSNLTANTIRINRSANDSTSDKILVRIWRVPPADFDSTWTDIDPGGANALVLPHGLTDDHDGFTVGMVFRDTEGKGLGVHQQYFGGEQAAQDMVGAHWQGLNGTTIKVVRWADDAVVDQVRLQIIAAPPPADFDSGWQPIQPGETITLPHNLGGRVTSYRVYTLFRETEGTTPMGIHLFCGGGCEVDDKLLGGHWQRLTPRTIQFYRQPGGTLPTDFRVRIWRLSRDLFLPAVMNQ